MARDSRKKEKQGLKREKKKQALRKASSENPFRRVARAGQPLECWVSSIWPKNGLADIFVSGRVPGGSDCLVVFLVDLFCVGLKDAYGRKDITRAQIREEFLEPREARRGKPDRIDVGDVRKLVAGGIRFSRQVVSFCQGISQKYPDSPTGKLAADLAHDLVQASVAE